MSVKIGLFGFGRTGSLVAQEIVADSRFSLEWVCRRQIPQNLKFASHALGFDQNTVPFVQNNQLSAEFLKNNPVDMVSSARRTSHSASTGSSWLQNF